MMAVVLAHSDLDIGGYLKLRLVAVYGFGGARRGRMRRRMLLTHLIDSRFMKFPMNRESINRWEPRTEGTD